MVTRLVGLYFVARLALHASRQQIVLSTELGEMMAIPAVLYALFLWGPVSERPRIFLALSISLITLPLVPLTDTALKLSNAQH